MSTPSEQPSLQLAQILSDLVTLRMCVRSRAATHPTTHWPYPFPSYLPHSNPLDPNLANATAQAPAAALALVTASKPKPASAKPTASTDDPGARDARDEDEDEDLRRAKELVELHYAVKEGHRRGELGRGLREARESVQRAVGGV
jgi:hypothetical protein